MALRRHRGTVNALGKAFYKGGFEPKINRREAALILEVSYVSPIAPTTPFAFGTSAVKGGVRVRRLTLNC